MEKEELGFVECVAWRRHPIEIVARRCNVASFSGIAELGQAPQSDDRKSRRKSEQLVTVTMRGKTEWFEWQIHSSPITGFHWSL